MQVTGTAALGGTLALTRPVGFVPNVGDTFVILTASSVTGTFANVTGTDAGGGNSFVVDYTPTQVIVRVGSPTLSADLAITKTDAPDPVVTGNDLTYTLTVTNSGPNAAANVTITDTLPGGVTFVSATGCTNPSGTVTCVIGTLGNGANAQRTIVVRPTVANPSLSNTATVTASTTDPNTANNSATATTVVSPAANLALTKTDAPDPALLGEELFYSLSVTNNGPDAASGVTITDTLPGGVTFVSASGCTNVSGTVTCSIGALANGANAQRTIVVRPTVVNPTLSNTASVSASTVDPVPGNNSSTATTVVNPAANLALTKTDSPDPVLAGQDLTYTLTVTNNGPSDAAGVTITDPLPSGVTFVSAGAGCTNASGTVTCTIGALANGANAVRTIVVRPTGAITNVSNTATASATTGDPNLSNNTATATTSVNAAANLALTKTDAPDPVPAGSDLTYTLTVTNNGPDSAGSVTITDPLPSGVTFVSASGCANTSGTVTCVIGTLANGANAQRTIVVRPTVANPSLSNTASVSSSTADPVPANNSATATTVVGPSADLALTKTDAPDPVLVGSNLTYTLTVTNNGPSDAAGVTSRTRCPAGSALSPRALAATTSPAPSPARSGRSPTAPTRCAPSWSARRSRTRP